MSALAPKGAAPWPKREPFWRALKFETEHALGQFFDASAAPKAAASQSATFDAMPLDERAHAFRELALFQNAPGQSELRSAMAWRLLDALIELDFYAPNEFEGANFFERLRFGSRLESLGAITRQMRLRAPTIPADAMPAASAIQAYLDSLPGWQPQAPKQASGVVEDHAAVVAIVAPLLRLAQDIQAKAELCLAPAAAMAFLVGRIDPTPFDGHWLADSRFFVIARRVARGEHPPGQDLSAWDFFQAALARPLDERRREAIACFLNLMRMPRRHYEIAQAALRKNLAGLSAA